jgi:hypothetical protein
MTIQKLFKKFIQCDFIIYTIVMLSTLSNELFLFNHMVNYKYQNLAKTTLWQHFMDNLVCFHPTLTSHGCQINVPKLENWTRFTCDSP